MYRILIISSGQFSDMYYNRFKDKFFQSVTVVLHEDFDFNDLKQDMYDAVIYQISYPLFENIYELSERIRSNFQGVFILVDYYSYIKHKLIAARLNVECYYPLIDGVVGLIRQTRFCLVSKYNIVDDFLDYKDLKLSLSERVCFRGDLRIDLRNREFELLKFLMENPNKVFTRQYLLESIWDINAIIPTNTVDTHISILRKKIDSGFDEKRLQTVHHVGYKLS